MTSLFRRLFPLREHPDVLLLTRENRRLAAQEIADGERITDLVTRLDIARAANVAAAQRIVALSAELEGARHQISARDVMIDEADREIQALRSSIAVATEPTRQMLLAAVAAQQ